MNKLEKAAAAVESGELEASRAARRYGVKVSEIRAHLAAQTKDIWGHTTLETFVHRFPLKECGRAIQAWRGEAA